MGHGDYLPIGGHRRRAADPKRIKKIQEGGKRADAIRQERENHHQAEELPAAEAELLKDLDALNA